MLYWKTIDKPRKKLLDQLLALPELQDFYLAGGTGLSLELGLRKSNDFDFFSEANFNAGALLASIEKATHRKAEVVTLLEGTCDLTLSGVQVSFFFYPHPLLKPLVRDPSYPLLKLASVEDIAAMKVSAIGGRGEKKDFYDLYQILQKKKLGAADLLRLLDQKYGPKGWNAAHYLMAFSYFEGAEQEPLPRCYVPCDWEAIKTSFLALQKEALALKRNKDRCL